MSKLARAALFLLALTGCKKEAEELPPSTDPGALVAVSMASTVGVLLDELPAEHVERGAELYLAESTEFWDARARMQIETTLYRLVYRNFYYDDAGQLPLPPRELWEISVSEPRRETIDGHDLVVVDYTLTATLLTGADQPGRAERKLASAGGVWEEPFTLPADPDLLLERTGYACMDEADFPPNSVDTENAPAFYDDLCIGDDTGCHVTEIPADDCVVAVKNAIGAVETVVRFERLVWDAALADDVRLGEQAPGIVQLEAVPEGVEDNRISYRYFPEDSCAIVEGCVGGPGWRRLLQFTATMKNRGALDAYLGDVGPESAAVQERLVSFSECHEHMHFNHYGDFSFGEGDEQLGSKRAFCLESTSRYFNNEDTPLVHPYGCHFQGTAAGWGDDYIAGLDCQWIDITPLDTTGGYTAPLTFHVNPDAFICEGEPILDEAGNLTFVPTSFTNEQGETESAIACEPAPDWESDNVATVSLTVPEDGGLVTGPCGRGQLGEKRNCGFTEVRDTDTCAPGAQVDLECTVPDPSTGQVLRICEASHVLDTGVACTWRDALASATIGSPTPVSFLCPEARDATEPGGRFAVYTAPVLLSDASQEVTCVGLPSGGGR